MVNTAIDTVPVTVLTGYLGAGKTTLLNLIGGFYQTQTGQIRLGQTDLTALSGLDIARAGVGRTFQATRLFDSLSVIDNLRVAAREGHPGSMLAALYVGKFYMVFRERNQVSALTRHFDHLIREARHEARSAGKVMRSFL